MPAGGEILLSPLWQKSVQNSSWRKLQSFSCNFCFFLCHVFEGWNLAQPRVEPGAKIETEKCQKTVDFGKTRLLTPNLPWPAQIQTIFPFFFAHFCTPESQKSVTFCPSGSWKINIILSDGGWWGIRGWERLLVGWTPPGGGQIPLSNAILPMIF